MVRTVIFFFLLELVTLSLFTDTTHMKRHHTVLTNTRLKPEDREFFLFQNNSHLMYYFGACWSASGWWYHYKHYRIQETLQLSCSKTAQGRFFGFVSNSSQGTAKISGLFLSDFKTNADCCEIMGTPDFLSSPVSLRHSQPGVKTAAQQESPMAFFCT